MTPSPSAPTPSFERRIQIARDAIDYIMGRTPDEQVLPVPNCPGWTVYNAMVHVGRTGVFWGSMMACRPDDTTARVRALAATQELPTGVAPEELATWIHATMDVAAADETKECYFSITGGPGNLGLWAWHASSEIGVHRLDVEAALGHPHALGDDDAADSVGYVAGYFLPAIRRAAAEDPGRITAQLLSSDGESIGSVDVVSEAADSGAAGHANVRGPAVQVLLALWGRPHVDVEVSGDVEVFSRWRELPGQVYQFGTWD